MGRASDASKSLVEAGLWAGDEGVPGRGRGGEGGGDPRDLRPGEALLERPESAGGERVGGEN